MTAKPPTVAEVRAEFARPCPCFQRMRNRPPRVEARRVYDDQGNEYPSAAAAARSLNLTPGGQGVVAALTGYAPTAAGRRWTRDAETARMWKRQMRKARVA